MILENTVPLLFVLELIRKKIWFERNLRTPRLSTLSLPVNCDLVMLDSQNRNESQRLIQRWLCWNRCSVDYYVLLPCVCFAKRRTAVFFKTKESTFIFQRFKTYFFTNPISRKINAIVQNDEINKRTRAVLQFEVVDPMELVLKFLKINGLPFVIITDCLMVREQSRPCCKWDLT